MFKTRQRDKLQKNFGSIADMTRQPAAVFIVDILKEHIALNEAKRLKISTFAMVDTNSNPSLVDFPIPSNDDATKSITIILDTVCNAIKEGLEERKSDKDTAEKNSKAKSEAKAKEKAEKVEAVKEVAEAAPVEEKAAEEKPKAAKKAPVKKAPAAKKAPAKKAPAKKAPAKKAVAKKEDEKVEESK